MTEDDHNNYQHTNGSKKLEFVEICTVYQYSKNHTTEQGNHKQQTSLGATF